MHIYLVQNNNYIQGGIMRIRIKFLAKQKILSLDYRYSCMSYIKHLLTKNYVEKFNELYMKNAIKSLTFNLYMPKSKITSEGIQLGEDSIYLNISSCDASLIYMLYNSAIKEKNAEYVMKDGFDVITQSVNILREKEITSESIAIKTLSPILVRKHDKSSNIDEYLVPGDEKFDKYLQINVQNLLMALGKDLTEIKLSPIEYKTTAVLLKGKYYKGFYGKFMLQGDKNTLKTLYDSGLGSRRSQGFGMFELED